MAQMTMRFNTTDVTKTIRQLKTRYPNAVRRALNRAVTSTRAVMASEMSKDLGLKVGVVKDELKIKEATVTHHVAEISVTGKRIPLINFNARGAEPSRGKGTGVRARLPGGRGHYPHAFIATMRSGHRGVFQRRGTARLPIAELHGPSLPHVFTKYMPLGLARGEESLRKNLQSELRFAASAEAA